MIVEDATTAFGTVTSSWRGVRSFVASAPVCTTVPSTSPILTNSPIRTAREYVIMKLLMTWFTELFLEPADAAMVEASRPAFLQAFLGRSSHIEGVPEPVIDKLVENMTLTGDLRDVGRIVQKLKALEAAGLDEVALRLHDDPEEALRVIGERLVPAFA